MATSTPMEIQRQQKALDQLPEDYSFPLFNAKHALESQRRSGYRSTASAAREIVDNAVEAGAKRIDVVLEPGPPGPGRRTVKTMAFIDDGPGMLPEMARYALSWGGGTHFEEHDFIGRFGFGLPNASINQTRRVDVFTRTDGDAPWDRVALDINDVSAFGVQTVEPPRPAELPEFVLRYLKKQDWVLGTGTVVVWDQPDRLSYKSVASLKEHLLEDFGVTYRYLLRATEDALAGVQIRVEATPVQPVDPLFLLPHARLFLSKEEGGAAVMFDEKLVVRYVPDPDEGEGHLVGLTDPAELDQPQPVGARIGAIQVRVVRFPPGLAVDKRRGGKEPTTDAHRRHDIRKRNHGMSFVRANREITTVTSYPRSPQDIANGLGRWPDLQAYTYHVGVEVRFDPVLDDVFGITNDKQGVRPIEDFWRLLAHEGVDAAVARERQWQVAVRKETRREAAQPPPDGAPTAAELAARAADVAGQGLRIPDRRAEEVRAALEEQAAALVGDGAQDLDEARQILRDQQKRRPYRVTYTTKEYGPFYEPDYDCQQIVVKINKEHPFFKVLYMDLLQGSDTARARNGLDLLLLTLARAELTCDDPEMELWYRTQRQQVWSPWLGTALEALDQTGGDEIDVDDLDEQDQEDDRDSEDEPGTES